MSGNSETCKLYLTDTFPFAKKYLRFTVYILMGRRCLKGREGQEREEEGIHLSIF